MLALAQSWGWPQWCAIIVLGLKILMEGREYFFLVNTAERDAELRNQITVALLWSLILSTGGFWS